MAGEPPSKRSLRSKLVSLTAASITFAALAASPQQPMAPTSPVQQTAIPETRIIPFEVVSIRRSHSKYSGGDMYTADGFSAHGLNLDSLLSFVYPYDDHHGTEGLPDWDATESYDILAKVAEADIAAWGKQTSRQHDLAIKALLEDRFHLKAHFEQREMPIYALVVAKNGPKLKAATPGDTYPGGVKGLNGQPLHGMMMRTGRGVFIGQDVPLSELANTLSKFAGRPIQDRTGLTGTYDITLKVERPQRNTSPQDNSESPSDPSGPSIFTIVQEQFGLKLEPAKGPVPFLVVDHIEKPTEN